MPFDPSELTRETSLLDIRREARKIAPSRFNQRLTVATAAACFAFSLMPTATPALLAGQTRQIAETGFNFATSILGFLIAGFTVFATITKEELFKQMAVVREPKSKLSYLKYNFFLFMRVFIDYMAFCGWCVFIKLAAFPDGPVSTLLRVMPGGEQSRIWMARIGFAFTAGAFVYVLLLLKSFIYNIYYVVMTSIRWSIEFGDPMPEMDGVDDASAGQA